MVRVWTPDEDKILLQLAAEFGQRDWVKIASRLNVCALQEGSL